MLVNALTSSLERCSSRCHARKWNFVDHGARWRASSSLSWQLQYQLPPLAKARREDASAKVVTVLQCWLVSLVHLPSSTVYCYCSTYCKIVLVSQTTVVQASRLHTIDIIFSSAVFAHVTCQIARSAINVPQHSTASHHALRQLERLTSQYSKPWPGEQGTQCSRVSGNCPMDIKPWRRM